MMLIECMCQEKKEEKEYSSIQDSIDSTTRRLHKKHKGRLITGTRNNTDYTSINRTKKKQENKKRKEKQLYGHLKRPTSEIFHEKIWTWLRKGNLKRNSISSVNSTKQRHIDYVKQKIKKTLENNRRPDQQILVPVV